MNAQQLADAAIERGSTFESMGTNPATNEDLMQYIEEIYHENDLQGEQMHDATTILFIKDKNALSLDKATRIPHFKELLLNCDEIYVLKLLLIRAWNDHGSMQFRELLGDEAESEEWLDDIVTQMTEKCKITPEETW